MAALAELKEHPKNYRIHPDDQIEHLCQSIREHGIYRNVVVACDGTILAGHGVVKACRKMQLTHVPVIQLSIKPDDVKAIKILTADNEISHLSEVDDRLLSELLKGISDVDTLLGTGYDEKMLANLVFVTRPKSEIGSINEAAEWVGMPDYEPTVVPFKTIVSFENEENRSTFYKLWGGVPPSKATDSMWWPMKEREDLASVKIQDEANNTDE